MCDEAAKAEVVELPLVLQHWDLQVLMPRQCVVRHRFVLRHGKMEAIVVVCRPITYFLIWTWHNLENVRHAMTTFTQHRTTQPRRPLWKCMTWRPRQERERTSKRRESDHAKRDGGRQASTTTAVSDWQPPTSFAIVRKLFIHGVHLTVKNNNIHLFFNRAAFKRKSCARKIHRPSPP